MKMIVAIIRDNDNEPVTQALIKDGFRVTRIASTGGFLRRGLSTLMIGVSDDQVVMAIQVIKNSVSPPEDDGTKRGTLFVLNVTEFSQI
jgi:uncharacterized protein YaaQ